MEKGRALDQTGRGPSRRQFLKGAGLGAAGLIVGACTPSTEGASTTAVTTGTTAAGATTATSAVATTGTSAAASVREIVMAIPGEPPTLFQNLEYQPQGYSVYDGVLEYLVKSDSLQPELGPQPQLATAWEPVSDTQWEFTLREGVKFHNGEDWNAEAAKANLDILLTIEPPSPVMFRIQPYVGCEVKDEFTLVVNTTEPWAMCPVGLSEVQFGAPAYLQDVGAQEFAQAPVGTGMFSLAEWQKGEQIVLERNGSYWGEQALLDRLIFRGIPDAATRFAALQAGEVHIVEDLELEDVSRLQEQGLLLADSSIAQSVLMTPYIIDATTDGHPTANPLVRLAMNHAIDRQGIIDSVLGGFGKLMQGQVTGSDAFGWNSGLTDYEYDPQKARDLLTEAGYPSGVDMGTFFIGVPGEFLKQSDFLEAVFAQLADVGILFQPEEVEYSTFLRMALQEYSLKYWHIGGWQYYPVVDSAFALMWYDTEAFLRTGLGNPAYDEVWRASNREFDLEARRALLEEAHQIIHDTPGPVFLWQQHKLYGYHPDVKGFVPTPDERVHWPTITI